MIPEKDHYDGGQIESGYGDLRKSEKQAADYILDHLEEAAELPLNRLAAAPGRGRNRT